jgi:signal transduction histidine kinase/CheY-like chemotaxis protein
LAARDSRPVLAIGPFQYTARPGVIKDGGLRVKSTANRRGESRSVLEFLAGGGEMGERIRAFPWSQTALGAPQNWPQGLRTALRVLLTTQHPVFIFWGAEHTCFYNDAYSRSIGPEKHPAMLGASGRAWWGEIWSIIGPQIEQVMRGGAATWHENQLVPIIRHGQLQDVYWTYSFGPIDELDAPNGVGGVLVICTETTQQVLTERRLKSERESFAQLFEQAPSFMVVLRGPEHRVELANPGYMRLIGHRDIIGKTIEEALPEARAQGYLDLLDEVYRSGKAYSASGARYTAQIAPDGPLAERYLDFVYQPIIDADGSVSGIFVEGFDTTSRRLADIALQDANRRKDEFLAMLAHELRNPLAPIRNAAEILARTIAAESETYPVVTMIRRQTDQLTRLVDDLLDVSRISQGRIELKKETLNVATLIDQAFETVGPLFQEKRQQVSLAPSFEPLHVIGDVTRLVQALVNVLTNAAKYTDRGGAIRIQTRGTADAVYIEVTDNGAGIPAELLPQIFELFVQGDRTLDRSQGGLGIGLAVVKKLIEMHGGQIIARSEGLGWGSSFELRLPRAPAPAAADAQSTQSNASARRVLIVDDNADAADSLALLLSLEGHETVCVYSAAAALQRVSGFAPDVVLLDIGLPDTDGYEVARRLRMLPGCAAIRLIALTGYGQPGDRDRAIAAGFEAHLVKPVDLTELGQLLAMPAPGPR